MAHSTHEVKCRLSTNYGDLCMFSNIVIMGNLGRDPETRYQADGTAVTNFSVAVSKRRKGKEAATTWFRCVAWNKTAEIAGEYLKKGQPVLVQGEMSSHDYTDKDGVTKTSWEVTVNQLTLMPRTIAGAQEGGAPAESMGAGNSPQESTTRPANGNLSVRTNAAPGHSNPAVKKPTFDDFEDDIPF